MISKEMLKRCSNELKQAFCALDKDVQNAIKENVAYGEILVATGYWHKGIFLADDSNVYRLSPDTPTEPEWAEYRITADATGYYLKVFRVAVALGCDTEMFLCFAPCHKQFLGIIYLKDGIETLRTSIDAAFGTPVRVRFSKP